MRVVLALASLSFLSFGLATPALATPPRQASPAKSSPAEAQPPEAPPSSRTASPPPLVLVIPFAAKDEAEPEWLSAGIAEFIGEGLSVSGHRVVDPEARQDALEATGLDAEKRLTQASACALGRRVGARYVVTGTWRADGTKLAFAARMIDVLRMKLVRESTASAHVSLLAPALGGIVLDLCGEAGKAPPARRELERLSQLRQEALMAWMQASAEPDNAQQALGAALAADPGFDRARLDLAEAQLRADDPEAVPATLQPIGPDAAVPHRARQKVLHGRAVLAMGDMPGAIALFEEAVRLDAQPEHLLWLGDAQLAAGRKDAARDVARRVLSLVPGDERAQDLLDQAEGRVASDDDAGSELTDAQEHP